MASKVSKPAIRKQWTIESMEAGLKAVQEGMGLRQAVRLYNLPYETLRRRVVGSVAVDCRPGPPSVFSKEEEEMLAQYCVNMADMGYGLSREDVMRTAYNLAEKSGRKHPFTNGLAGRAWFGAFLRRNPRLSIRTPQSLNHSRAKAGNEQNIQEFFAKLGAIMARLNLLTKPMLIYNLDETGITIVHKPGKVVAQLGRKNVWHVTSAEKGKTHTVMTCGSASGYVVPPTIIFPRVRMNDKLMEGAVPGTLCVFRKWMDNAGNFP